jgi:hypothetical protein
MQRLDAAVHDLGEAGLLRHLDDAEAGVAQCAAGAARGYNLDAEFGETLCKRDQAPLVGYAEQRSSHGKHGVTCNKLLI